MYNVEELKLLACTYEENGDYASAHKLYRRALVIQEKSIGKHQIELVPLIYDLAMVCAVMDRDNEARKLFARLEQTLPANHEIVGEVKLVMNEMQEELHAA